MRLVRRLSLLAACLVSLVTADPAAAQFTIGGDPRVNPADFRITTFATGLNYPNGLARLSDGSILVATNNPNGSGMFFVSSGALLRFTDTNDDGIADGPGQVMYSDPVGVWTGLAVTGNMVFVISAKDNANRIIVLKMNNGPASPYTFVGTLNFTFPAGWEHKAYVPSRCPCRRAAGRGRSTGPSAWTTRGGRPTAPSCSASRRGRPAASAAALTRRWSRTARTR